MVDLYHEPFYCVFQFVPDFKIYNCIIDFSKIIIVSCYCVLCVGAVSVRLVGGSSYDEGRVEVYYNGEWGTVCDNGWDNTDAGVVCRQLGFGSSGTAYSSAFFGQGSGPIWLDNVACTGFETILARCGHLGVNTTRNCSHNEDVGVRCFGEQGTVTYVFLLLLIL